MVERLFWHLPCLRIPHIRRVCYGFSDCEQFQNSHIIKILGLSDYLLDNPKFLYRLTLLYKCHTSFAAGLAHIFGPDARLSLANVGLVQQNHTQAALADAASD